MKCGTVRKQFDELCRQGGSDPDDPAWRHLVSCADCTREFRRWKKIAVMLEHAGPVDLPEAFAQKVMIAFENRQRRIPWFNPMPIRLPQAAWAMLVLVLLGAGVMFIPRFLHQPLEPRFARVTTKNIRFELAAAEASCVALVGDFNGWNRKACMLKPEKKGRWSTELPLSAGSYQYLFLIDNKIWRLDTLNIRSSPDGYGGTNSEITL